MKPPGVIPDCRGSGVGGFSPAYTAHTIRLETKRFLAWGGEFYTELAPGYALGVKTGGGGLAPFLKGLKMSLFEVDDDDFPLVREEPAKPALKKLRYTHDAMIDEIIVNPSVSQGEIAQRFGFTETWVSIVINSDAFQEKLAERKAQLVDPKISASVEDRLAGIAARSLDRIAEKLDSPTAGNIKIMELVAIAKLGVGDRNITKNT